MNAAATTLLNNVRLPWRLDVDQVAVILGFDVEDITILMNHRLLIPIAEPARNAQKFFYPEYIDGLGRDREWMARATTCIYANTREKNRLKALRKEMRDAQLKGQLFPKNERKTGT